MLTIKQIHCTIVTYNMYNLQIHNIYNTQIYKLIQYTIYKFIEKYNVYTMYKYKEIKIVNNIKKMK